MPGLTGDPQQALDPERLFAPLAPYRRIGLAVSGGPDSLALMLLAARFAAQSGDLSRFMVYSVDHGLRAEAADEVAFVLAEARRLGLGARGLRWSGAKPDSGLQEAARIARYRLMRDAMVADAVDVLVTAHHLADQAETVLMRMAHSSGLEGLRGMDVRAEVEGVTIYRPLLRTHPAVLEALVREAGITPVRDPSNADTTYERVRWRNVLPVLKELGLTPERLALLADRAREADAAIGAAAQTALGGVLISSNPPLAAFSRSQLAQLPRAVAVRLVDRTLARVATSGRRRPLASVERLTDRLVAGPLRTTLAGCLIVSDGTAIRIAREPLKGARARHLKAALS